MKHSEWTTPTTEEVKELEYTQLEENNGASNSNSKGNGNGNGNGNPSVPVSGGIGFILLLAFFYGFYQARKKRLT